MNASEQANRHKKGGNDDSEPFFFHSVFGKQNLGLCILAAAEK